VHAAAFYATGWIRTGQVAPAGSFALPECMRVLPEVNSFAKIQRQGALGSWGFENLKPSVSQRLSATEWIEVSQDTAISSDRHARL
jgi:hypothetical protein